MTRREFTKAVRVEIIKRATAWWDRNVYCEKCGVATARFEIHHYDQDAMQTDKSRKLTVADGILLCLPCHKEETVAQAPVLAKAKRREARYLGAVKPKGKIRSAGFTKTERTHGERESLPPRSIYK